MKGILLAGGSGSRLSWQWHSRHPRGYKGTAAS
jgi:dTDP-glucose pyrophosphorylase